MWHLFEKECINIKKYVNTTLQVSSLINLQTQRTEGTTISYSVSLDAKRKSAEKFTEPRSHFPLKVVLFTQSKFGCFNDAWFVLQDMMHHQWQARAREEQPVSVSYVIALPFQIWRMYKPIYLGSSMRWAPWLWIHLRV